MSEYSIRSESNPPFHLDLKTWPDSVTQILIQADNTQHSQLPDRFDGAALAIQLNPAQIRELVDYLEPFAANGKAEIVEEVVESILFVGEAGWTEDHETILDEAQRIVHGPRRASYGHPRINFGRIAFLWNAWLQAKTLESGVQIPVDLLDDTDVAQMMIHLKQCRLIQNPADRDGHTDIVGYAACSAIINEIDPS